MNSIVDMLLESTFVPFTAQDKQAIVGLATGYDCLFSAEAAARYRHSANPLYIEIVKASEELKSLYTSLALSDYNCGGNNRGGSIKVDWANYMHMTYGEKLKKGLINWSIAIDYDSDDFVAIGTRFSASRARLYAVKVTPTDSDVNSSGKSYSPPVTSVAKCREVVAKVHRILNGYYEATKPYDPFDL